MMEIILYRRITQLGALLTLLLLGTACVNHADRQCVSDQECRGDRVCSEYGWCIDPGGEAEPDAGDARVDTDVVDDADTRPPEPNLVVDPDQLSFPIPDSTATQRIEWKLLSLQNRGGLPLELDAIDVPDSNSFTLRFPRGDAEPGDEPGDEPAEPPAEIAPGDSVQVRIWYATDDAREESATLEIRSNDPDSPVTRVPLIANPNPPCIEFPNGDEIVFDTSSNIREKNFSVSNCSSRNDLIIEGIRLEQDGGGALALDETRLPEFPVRLGAGEVLNSSVQLISEVVDWNRGVIVIESNDPYRRRSTVDVLRDSSGNDCPVASVQAFEQGSDVPIENLRQIEPGTAVELDGSGSADPDGSIARYEWRIIESPTPTSLLPTPTTPRPTLTLDQPGTYVVELDVYDDTGTEDCAAPGRILMVATRNDIRVEVEWRTPGDPDPSDDNGANVDLHYLHPNGRWNEQPWDIWEDHPTEDWSRIQRPDTPPEMLEITENGPGREALYHATPEWDLEFSVGVHYADDRGFGASFATVRLISDDQVIWESREVRLVRTGEFYEAAHFAMPGPTIIEIDERSPDFPLR